MINKRILLAGTENSNFEVHKALSQKYDSHLVTTLKEAKRLLNVNDYGQFDMIVAGIHFDDCRMFELLEHVRSAEYFDRLPFLVIQARSSISNDMETIKKAAELLGASGFIELHSLPEEIASQTLLKAVDLALNKAVKYIRLDKSVPKLVG